MTVEVIQSVLIMWLVIFTPIYSNEKLVLFKDPFDDEGKQNEDIRTKIAIKIKR